MKNKSKIIILILLSVFLIYFFLFEFEKGEQAIQDTKNFILSAATSIDNEVSIPKPTEEDLPQHEITISAWIPYWDESRGFTTFTENSEQIESVSPVWFYVNADGSITQRKSDEKIIGYVKEVKAYNGKIIPTITNGSSKELSDIINNSELLEKHTEEIVKKVIELNFDGIDIDYENLESNDKDAFSNFIKTLAEKLHQKNKLLTIAVLPKTDNIIYQFSPSRQAQNWEEIGANVDEFRIMGYDWSHNSTTESGPIAPTYWIEEVLEYALTKVDKKKIVIGLPLYGYFWKNNSVEALTWEQAEELKKQSNYEWDETSKENHLIVSDGNAWYHNARSVQERKKIAQEYEIKGIIFWRLGGEDPNIWE